MLPINHETWAQNGVGLCAAIVIIAYFFVMIVRRIGSSPPTPDPWSKEVSAALNDETAEPLCTHCLMPHTEEDDFCAHCGGPVGALATYRPMACYLSTGHIWRIGTEGNFNPSLLMALGFCMCPFAGRFFILIPFYWFRILTNFIRLREMPRPEVDPKATPE